VRASVSGRPRVTTARQDRDILRAVKKNRKNVISQIQQDTGLENISKRTISSRIHELLGFKSYWTTKKPLLTKKHKKERFEWAQRHIKWTTEQWGKVLWSDESPFCLTFSGRERVWRDHVERYITEAVSPTKKKDLTINVWGCFASNGIGSLVLIDGIMDAKGYRNILKKYMLSSAEILFQSEEFTFQQDNDPKHTSDMVQDFLSSKGVEVMAWPAQSPDLNPIENLWSYLDRKCKQRRPKSDVELFEILSKEWNLLDQSLLEELVKSMPRRCQAVIDVKGSHTKY